MARRAAALTAHGRGSDAYRAANRAVRAAIRADVKNDISGRIAEDGPASVWRNMRRVVSGGKQGSGSCPPVSPGTLNDYFVGVGPRVAAEAAAAGPAPRVPVRLPRVGACAFTIQPVTLEFLEHIIFSMRNSSASGTDGICIRVLKMSFSAVGPVLMHIVNSCIVHNDIPASWKHALIHPIHKSGDPNTPSNYRPISILPVITKVVEKVVQHQLQHYLSHNRLLSPTQHGFRPYHSTESALIQVSDRVLSGMDQGHISLLCLIDLSKAFDVISHSKLLEKFQLYGIDTAWFHHYLSGHTQSVSVSKTQVSAPRAINQGVFQGSALGPLLFSIYVNDLSFHASDAFVTQYADDTQILFSGPKSTITDLAAKIETSLHSLDDYFRSNGLKVNETKFELLPIGTRQNLQNLPKFTVQFRGTSLHHTQRPRTSA